MVAVHIGKNLKREMVKMCLKESQPCWSNHVKQLLDWRLLRSPMYTYIQIHGTMVMMPLLLLVLIRQLTPWGLDWVQGILGQRVGGVSEEQFEAGALPNLKIDPRLPVNLS